MDSDNMEKHIFQISTEIELQSKLGFPYSPSIGHFFLKPEDAKRIS
jgi:hypothetical protein